MSDNSDHHPKFDNLVELPSGGSNPWDRQPGEREKSYEVFCLYRSMATPRSIPTLAKSLGRSKRSIQSWAQKYNWIARVAAYDDELERRYCDSTVGQVEMAGRKHKRLARMLQQAGGKEIRAILARMKLADEIAEAEGLAVRKPVVSAATAVKLLKTGVDLERLILGEPSEHVKQDTGVDFSKLSQTDQLTLERILRKAEK